MSRILLVEDDNTLGMTLEMTLTAIGHEVRWSQTLAQAVEAMEEKGADLVLLDLGLPDGDGIDFCRELRAQGVIAPILIITARDSLKSRVSGLREGADDYVTKPFELPELLARIQGLLRRQKWHGPEDTVHVGELTLERAKRKGTRDGHDVGLTDLEFRVLEHLISQKGAVVSRKELLRDVWDQRSDTRTRTVDVFMGRLRKYIEVDPANPSILLNARGVGYRLVIAEKEDK